MKAESSSDDTLHAQSQDQPRPEASSGSGQLSAFGNLRKLEQPDLADRSSQSSFTSQDGTGNERTKVLRQHAPTAPSLERVMTNGLHVPLMRQSAQLWRKRRAAVRYGVDRCL